MIALSNSEQATVKKIIQSYVTGQQYQVVVFGSRATGTAKKYSDVDLALIGSRPVPVKIVAALSEAFEDSSLPYTVDIVDFTQASAELQNQIKQYGVELMTI